MVSDDTYKLCVHQDVRSHAELVALHYPLCVNPGRMPRHSHYCSTMRTVRVVIIGFGAVGQQVAQLLLERSSTLQQRHGVHIRLVAICSQTKGFHREAGLTSADLHNPDNFITGASGAHWLQNEVSTPDVLFECGPSDFDKQPYPSSLPYYRLMLNSGKSIITTSKSALVSHGHECFIASKEHGGYIGLSGAAGAALPALDLLRNSVVGCTVNSIEACLNATSNYILDSLMRGSIIAPNSNEVEEPIKTLDEAIALAQRQGFAERDVTRDLDGFDSMAKVTLLANFGLLPKPATEFTRAQWLWADNVQRSGLSDKNVTPDTLAEWADGSMTPRLVSKLDRNPRAWSLEHNQPSTSLPLWSASVSLQMYPPSHPFSCLRGTSKGILISTEEMGDVFASACGPEPTATAASALKDFEEWLALCT